MVHSLLAFYMRISLLFANLVLWSPSLMFRLRSPLSLGGNDYLFGVVTQRDSWGVRVIPDVVIWDPIYQTPALFGWRERKLEALSDPDGARSSYELHALDSTHVAVVSSIALSVWRIDIPKVNACTPCFSFYCLVSFVYISRQS